LSRRKAAPPMSFLMQLTPDARMLIAPSSESSAADPATQ
jgi:hypothetical protein